MTFDQWFKSKQGEAYDSMYLFARDAWQAAQAAEREAIVKVCIKIMECEENTASECVDAIRARREDL